MEHRNLQAAIDALVAIKGLVGDALASPHLVPVVRPRVAGVTLLELASDLKPLQHAALVHHFRCEASREELLLIREAVEEALQLLDAGDEEIASVLELAEPYRHHLYTRVTVAALRAAEQERIKREMKYWRGRGNTEVPRPKVKRPTAGLASCGSHRER